MRINHITSPPRRLRVLRGALILAVCAAVFAVGCGGGSATGGDGGGSTSGDAGGSEGKKAKVAYVDGSCTNAWRLHVRAEWEHEAETNPDVESFDYTCAQGELNQAIAAVQSYTSQGYDVINVFSDFGGALLPALRAAHKQGVVVVPWLVDVGGKPGTDYDAFVGEALDQFGSDTAAFLAEKMDGKGNVVAISGPAGNAYNETLNTAIEDNLKELAPDIRWLETAYADWDPGKSAQAASALLAKYDQIDAVVIDEATAVPPVLARWRAADRPLPIVYTNDLNGLMKTYEELKPDNPTFGYGFRSARTYGSRNALQVALQAFKGEEIDESLLKVTTPSYDCDEDCEAMYRADMPDSYNPTSKVPAEDLKPKLEGQEQAQG